MGCISFPDEIEWYETIYINNANDLANLIDACNNIIKVEYIKK